MDKRLLLEHCFQSLKSISCMLEGFANVNKGSQLNFHKLLKGAVSNVSHCRTLARCSKSTMYLALGLSEEVSGDTLLGGLWWCAVEAGFSGL